MAKKPTKNPIKKAVRKEYIGYQKGMAKQAARKAYGKGTSSTGRTMLEMSRYASTTAAGRKNRETLKKIGQKEARKRVAGKAINKATGVQSKIKKAYTGSAKRQISRERGREIQKLYHKAKPLAKKIGASESKLRHAAINVGKAKVKASLKKGQKVAVKHAKGLRHAMSSPLRGIVRSKAARTAVKTVGKAYAKKAGKLAAAGAAIKGTQVGSKKLGKYLQRGKYKKIEAQKKERERMKKRGK